MLYFLKRFSRKLKLKFCNAIADADANADVDAGLSMPRFPNDRIKQTWSVQKENTQSQSFTMYIYNVKKNNYEKILSLDKAF